MVSWKKWSLRNEEVQMQWDGHNYLKLILKVLNLSVCLHIQWNSICSKTDSTFHDIRMTSDAVCMINIRQCATPRGQLPCVWHNVIFFCKVMNICKAITVSIDMQPLSNICPSSIKPWHLKVLCNKHPFSNECAIFQSLLR